MILALKCFYTSNYSLVPLSPRLSRERLRSYSAAARRAFPYLLPLQPLRTKSRIWLPSTARYTLLTKPSSPHDVAFDYTTCEKYN